MTDFRSNSILDQIGNTPLVKIQRLNPNKNVAILAKLECFNPGGSVKDRIAKNMIEAAEKSGELTRDKTVLEPTSGNTGIGLALVCAVKGYRLQLAMSEGASMERRQILSALGAEILLTPGHLGTDGAIEEAYRLARENPDRYYLPDQFNNPANMMAHYEGTGREVWEQTEGRVTTFVASMGTTGTLMGSSMRLKEYNPNIEIVGAEPYLGHKIQGLKNLKEAYVPGIYDRARIDELVYIDDEDAFEMTRRLAREEGLLVGMSSGAAMHVAVEKARRMKEGVIVVILPDGGERYLSTNLFVTVPKAALVFYNVPARTKEPFKPLRPGHVSMYSCGPALFTTLQVATYRHLVVADLLKRYLKYGGCQVEQVVDVIDIDDRTIEASSQAGEELKTFTEKYFQEFLHDSQVLGIERADHYPRASEHVPEMIALGRKLAESGVAYEKLRSLYFNISRFTDYGKISGVDLSKIMVGKTVDLDEYEKDNPRDFTLFKRSTLAELKRGLYYQTRWGSVRPGWHIECAAMSTTVLGPQYDIHTGGADLNFPHHENVNAIVETAYGQPMARHWIHSELVLVGGQKMSRSHGNAPTVRQLLDQGFSGRVIRFWLLSTHYRKPLTFSQKHLEAARTTLSRLDEFMARLRDGVPGDGVNLDQHLYDLRQNFNQALDDDLGIAQALAALFTFIRHLNPFLGLGALSRDNIHKINDLLRQIDQVLRIIDFEPQVLDEDCKRLLEQRDQARQEKNYAEADRLRQELLGRGVKVIDSKTGTRWQWI
jgi:cysteinyl-tRNA synthetase